MTSREKLLKLRSDFYKQDPVDYDSTAYFTAIERDLEILEAQGKIISECIDLLRISGQHTKQIVLEKLLKVKERLDGK